MMFDTLTIDDLIKAKAEMDKILTIHEPVQNVLIIHPDDWDLLYPEISTCPRTMIRQLSTPHDTYEIKIFPLALEEIRTIEAYVRPEFNPGTILAMTVDPFYLSQSDSMPCNRIIKWEAQI